MQLGRVDYAILALYFLFVIAIGVMIRKRMTSSEDFLTSGHSVPLDAPEGFAAAARAFLRGPVEVPA